MREYNEIRKLYFVEKVMKLVISLFVKIVKNVRADTFSNFEILDF